MIQIETDRAGRDDKVRAKHCGLNRKYFFMMAVISAVILFLMIVTISRFDSVGRYVDENNKASIHALLEQAEHTYHARLNQIYNEMKAVESYLFTGNDRKILLKDHGDYFKSLKGEDLRDVVFISRDSRYMSAGGSRGTLELESGKEQLFRDGQSIAQSCVCKDNGEEFFIVARLTDPFTVDGAMYDALAFTYDSDVMESAFSFPAYGSKATVYVTDEESELVYAAFSERSEKSSQNYNILRNMLENGIISKQVYKYASDDFAAGSSGTMNFQKDGQEVYVAYRPLNDSPYMIVCEVPKSVVQNSMMDFNYMISHTWVLIVSITILLMMIIGISIFFTANANKEIEFERKNMAQQKIYNAQLSNANKALAEAVSAAEKARKEADMANAAKTDFLSNMSHDIRTPLNAVTGLTSLLIRNSEDPVLVREHARKLTGACGHLMGLINDILDMSRIEEKKMALDIGTVSLAEIIREADSIIRPQARAKNQNFRINAGGLTNEYIEGDRTRLVQIAVNILSNAVKYTHNGGNITFDITELPQSDAGRVSIQMTVTDNGQGMSEEFQKIIFQPFAREMQSENDRIQGTGLGMAIVGNLVDMMGGSISVNSVLGKGSVFEVKLSFRKGIPERGPSEIFAQAGVFNVLLVGSGKCDGSGEFEKMRRMKELFMLYGVSSAEVSGTQEVLKTLIPDKENINKHFDAVIFEINEYRKSDGSAAVAASEFESVKKAVRSIKNIMGSDSPMLILSLPQSGCIEKEIAGMGIDGCVSEPFFMSEFSILVENIRSGRRTTGRIPTFYKNEENILSEDGSCESSVPAEWNEGWDEGIDEYTYSEDADCGDSDSGSDEGILDGMKIMIVDDNGMNSDILSELLCIEGAACVCAENGKEAVELFENSKKDEYDAILMDVRMPVMNGYEAAKMIRSSDRPDGLYVPIIAMTANAFESDVKEALDAGMNAHISKPVDMNIVNETLKPYKREESA